MFKVIWAKGADLSLENYYLDVREGRVLKLSSLDNLKLFELAAISESIRTIHRLLSANPLAIGQASTVLGFRKITIGPMTAGYRTDSKKRLVQVCVLHYFRRRN